MHDLRIGGQDLLASIKPDTFVGAALYMVIFVCAALILGRVLRAALHAAMTRQGHVDRTTITFLQQFGSAAIWVLMLILYAHLIPVLRSLGTALLTGASIASVVIGLAAQSTLGNLIAGVSITLYRPFRLGDTLQITAPTGTETGTVDAISLGYTTVRTTDGRLVVLPNALAASQATINLSHSVAGAPVSIRIRVNRDADVGAARQLAQRIAKETVGEHAVLGCFLTRIEAESAVLELRVRTPADANREELHSRLVAALAGRFAEAGVDTHGTVRTRFS
jgi:small conductance mechanosensitive channel